MSGVAAARLTVCVCDTEHAPCNKHAVDVRAEKNLEHFHMACSSTPTSKGFKTLALDSTAGLGGCLRGLGGKEENVWLLVKQDS